MIDVIVCAKGNDELRFVSHVSESLRDTVRISRRCADTVELLAVVNAGLGDVVVLDVSLDGVDAECVRAIRAASVAVVAINSSAPRRTPEEFGIEQVIDAHDLADSIYQKLLFAVAMAQEEPENSASPFDLGGQELGGKLVAVWGPHGSPGRSFVASHLAWETSHLLDGVLLIDADTYGPSQAQIFGVMDDASGLVGACRSAARGSFTGEQLADSAPALARGCHLLTGIGVSRRHGEVQKQPLETVLDVSRTEFSTVICDIAAPVESDNGAEWGAPMRNLVSRTVLEKADHIVAVVASDPISVARFVREVEYVREISTAAMTVVINKSEATVAPEKIEKTLRARLDFAECIYLPLDSVNASRALWDGAMIREIAPRSALQKAISLMAKHVAAECEPSCAVA